MNLNKRQDEVIEALAVLSCWVDRFNFIMSLGEEMPVIKECFRTPEHIIPGCISRTYFRAYTADGVIRCEGWSNAAVPSGLIALCREVFDGLATEELSGGVDIYFHTKSGLLDSLTPARRQALMVMIARVMNIII